MRAGLSIWASKSPPWPKDKIRAMRSRSADSKRLEGRSLSDVNDAAICSQSLQGGFNSIYQQAPREEKPNGKSDFVG